MWRLIASALTAVFMLLGAWFLHARWPWFSWHRYADDFVQKDGRVIEDRDGARTTSRSQAYALFFALVADDRRRFASILSWADGHLADGQLGAHLPASVWGRRDDGSFGVIDAQPAAGADLWFAYDLLEAARLWKQPRLAVTGRALLARVAADQTGAVGVQRAPMLLPHRAAEAAQALVVLHPGDFAEFQFRYFEETDPSGPWRAIWQTYLRLLQPAVRHGVVPGRFTVDAQGQVADPPGSDDGDIEALRVYLWTGMTPVPRRALLDVLAPAAMLIQNPPQAPAPFAAVFGRPGGEGSDTFSAAMLPFALALDNSAAAESLARRADEFRRSEMRQLPLTADEASLQLFGEGWYHHRFRFDADGRLQPRWQMF
jgi:endoglucanase